MRRELQEARASRNLVENHAAKCVNAVSRSVTPVTFDTPCITSTPVRTALADTRSLPPVLPSTTSSHTFSASSFSALRSRSAEVSAFLVSGTTDRNSEPAPFKDSPRSTTEDVRDASASRRTAAVSANGRAETNPTEVKAEKNETENQDSEFTDTKNFWDVCITELADCLASLEQTKKTCDTATNVGAEKSPVVTKEETQTNLLSAVVATEEEERATSQLAENCTEVKTAELPTEKIETKTSTSPDVIVVEERVGDRTCKVERSVDHANWQKPCDFPRGSCKRSRRRKCELKRWLSETDKSSKNQHQATKTPVDGGISSGSTSRDRTLNADESCPNDKHSRAITEVPEVTVVGGGSIMPRDLCSTGPLTSRTKTAPSRATYTTAYI